MSDIVSQSDNRAEQNRPMPDVHEAAGYAFGSNYAALLREREELRNRVDRLLAEQGAYLARIAELTRANAQKDKRETEYQAREAALHEKVSHLVATVEIVRDALDKAVEKHNES